MERQEINLVWFKRDLRFTDHEPLFFAQQSGLPLLLIYIFEPSVMAYHDSDVRHWRFVFESLKEMNEKLKSINANIYIFHNEAKTVFETLINSFTIHTVFSSQEIGNGLTYERDKEIKKLLQNHNVKWKEYQTNGIIRKLKSRKEWQKRWEEKMLSQPSIVVENELNVIH